MAELSAGQIVFSKSGRDKGLAFVVLKVCGEYAYIADGKLRTISKPKKKKIKHIQPVNRINESIAKSVKENMHILDSDLRKAVIEFTNIATAHN